jgi:hypothetical protein
MPPLDPSGAYARDYARFEQRCRAEFSGVFGKFLATLWEKRCDIDLSDRTEGVKQIYSLYVRGSIARGTVDYDSTVMMKFIDEFKSATTGCKTKAQGKNKQTRKHIPIEVKNGGLLWKDFLRVYSPQPNPGANDDRRVYMHAADWPSSLRLMTIIVSHFRDNLGLRRAKVACPGAQSSERRDTIVCRLTEVESANKLVDALRPYREFVIDTLPRLVDRVAPGIGWADEPPEFQIEDKTQFSFGTFYAELCWFALTESAGKPNKMLDVMLDSLGEVGVDPKRPHRLVILKVLADVERDAHFQGRYKVIGASRSAAR